MTGNRNTPPHRMRDLIRETGASREAIRFYINEGLLPQPHKTAPNMAWYSDEHIQRIKLIKALQEEQFLPLKAIRALLEDTDEVEFTPRQKHFFETVRRRIANEHADDPPPDPMAKLAEELAISEAELDDIRAHQLLDIKIRDGQETVSEEDAELLRLWAQMRDAGLSLERGFAPSDMEMLQQVVDIHFHQEMKLFRQRLGDLRDEEAARMLDEIVPAINRSFAILHERKIREFVSQFTEEDAEDSAGDAQ